MMQRPQTVTKIVLAACTLHNMLVDKHLAKMEQAADKEDPTTHEVIVIVIIIIIIIIITTMFMVPPSLQSHCNSSPGSFEPSDEVLPGEWRQQDQEDILAGIQTKSRNTASASGKKVREYPTEYYNDFGAVPWQNRMVGLPNKDA